MTIKKLELEDKNLGEPTCPDIIINKEGEASETIPQAWEYEGNWYYNWEGAMKEVDFLGKILPSAEDWGKICKPYGNDGERMSKELGLSFEGYRSRNTGYYNNQSVNARYWSSNPRTSGAFVLGFNTSNISPTNSSSRAYGFSVRCLKN